LFSKYCTKTRIIYAIQFSKIDVQCPTRRHLLRRKRKLTHYLNCTDPVKTFREIRSPPIASLKDGTTYIHSTQLSITFSSVK
jgi:hypothetical protein